MREIIRLAGGRMKDLTLEIYTSSRFGGLSRKELAKIYGLTVNRIAKEITKANRIMELLVRNYLDIIPVIFLLTAVFSAGETGFTSLWRFRLYAFLPRILQDCPVYGCQAAGDSCPVVSRRGGPGPGFPD